MHEEVWKPLHSVTLLFSCSSRTLGVTGYKWGQGQIEVYGFERGGLGRWGESPEFPQQTHQEAGMSSALRSGCGVNGCCSSILHLSQGWRTGEVEILYACMRTCVSVCVFLVNVTSIHWKFRIFMTDLNFIVCLLCTHIFSTSSPLPLGLFIECELSHLCGHACFSIAFIETCVLWPRRSGSLRSKNLLWACVLNSSV